MKETVICMAILVGFVACDLNSRRTVYENYDQGLKEAAQRSVNVLLVFDFWGNPNQSAERLIYDKTVYPELKDLIVVLLRVDAKGAKGVYNRQLQSSKYGTSTQPMYYLLDHTGQVMKEPIGYCNKEELLNYLLGE